MTISTALHRDIMQLCNDQYHNIVPFPKEFIVHEDLWMYRRMGIELMPHIYDTKTLTMVVEAQQSVNLFEEKKRTT